MHSLRTLCLCFLALLVMSACASPIDKSKLNRLKPRLVCSDLRGSTGVSARADLANVKTGDKQNGQPKHGWMWPNAMSVRDEVSNKTTGAQPSSSASGWRWPGSKRDKVANVKPGYKTAGISKPGWQWPGK